MNDTPSVALPGMPLDVDVVNVAPEGPELRNVLALGKSAKQTVGFLPDSAFIDRARQGTLVGVRARSDRHMLAYALYDLPRDEIKLVQLVVEPSQERQGLARALLEVIAERHPTRRGISLSCRNDFPAHQVWPRLGFTPVAERAGRSIDGKPLTRWWKGFGHPDLISLIDEADLRPTAALDSCTFFNVVAPEPHQVAEQLRADWVGDHARLVITDEVRIEITRGTDPSTRHRQLEAAAVLKTASPPETVWKPLVARLRQCHPNAPDSDLSDLRHLARAIAADAQWFVTDDPKLRSRYAASAETIGGLRVVSPSEFIRDLDRSARADWYRPIELERTSVQIREVDSTALGDLAPTFVNHRAGETIGDLRRRLEGLAAQPQLVRLQIG